MTGPIRTRLQPIEEAVAPTTAGDTLQWNGSAYVWAPAGGGGGAPTTATAGTPLWPFAALYEAAENDGMPIILAQNEGIVIRCTVPATGTWTGSFDMTWMELAAY